MASWLVHLSLDREVQVRSLSRNIVLSHSASLYPGVSMGTSEFDAGVNPAMD